MALIISDLGLALPSNTMDDTLSAWGRRAMTDYFGIARAAAGTGQPGSAQLQELLSGE